MGIRIAFYEATDGKGLLDNFKRTFSEFRIWLLDQNQISIDQYDERLINENLQTYLQQSKDVLQVDSIPQPLLDELMVEYLLTYSDYGEGADDFDLIGPLIYRRRYDNSFIEIEKQQDERLSSYWNYLKVGRSLKDDNPFTEIDHNSIGFWNASEVRYIKRKIQNMTKDDVGILAVSNALDELRENSELIFNLEI